MRAAGLCAVSLAHLLYAAEEPVWHFDSLERIRSVAAIMRDLR